MSQAPLSPPSNHSGDDRGDDDNDNACIGSISPPKSPKPADDNDNDKARIGSTSPPKSPKASMGSIKGGTGASSSGYRTPSSPRIALDVGEEQSCPPTPMRPRLHGEDLDIMAQRFMKKIYATPTGKEDMKNLYVMGLAALEARQLCNDQLFSPSAGDKALTPERVRPLTPKYPTLEDIEKAWPKNPAKDKDVADAVAKFDHDMDSWKLARDAKLARENEGAVKIDRYV